MTRRLRSRNDGFTLIEMMVTIAIAAILMAVAAPSFIAFQRNAELVSASNALVSGIAAARGEAMKRGRRAYLVPADGAQWRSGWIAFVDGGDTPDQQPGSPDDVTVLTQGALPPHFSVSSTSTGLASPPYILFDPSGYPRQKSTGAFTALTFSITRNDLDAAAALDQTRRVIISQIGRVRTCRPQSATDDNCKADADTD